MTEEKNEKPQKKQEEWVLGLEHIGNIVIYCRKMTPPYPGAPSSIQYSPAVIVSKSKNIQDPKTRAANLNVFVTQGGLGDTKYDCFYSKEPSDGRWCLREDMIAHEAKRSTKGK